VFRQGNVVEDDRIAVCVEWRSLVMGIMPHVGLLISTLLVAAIVSLLGNLVIVCTERWHAHKSFDKDTTGIQKIHKKPVPRIGGLALFVGLLAVHGSDLLNASTRSTSDDELKFSLLLVSAMPAFVAGLIEDLTKTVSALTRLLATFASALAACWLLGAFLPRLDVWGLDFVMQWAPAAMVVTAFAVAGVANSMNVIDGFNGLAGAAAIAMLSGIGFVAWHGGDTFIVHLAAAGVGASVGFLCLNYPTGRVFMGDGGAYLLGFWIAETAVLAVMRNPAIITWHILAICAYPIIEVLFSMYRRKVMGRAGVGVPDRLHLHSLIYRRLVCRVIPRNDKQSWIRNAAVALIIMAWIIPITFAAILFGDSIQGAALIILIQTLMYLIFYARLVRGRWCLNPAIVLGFRPSHRTKPL
jgi:UDP-N-acetylmuramyl pentapeptide phosphotransferase/UDP-N-acetylglucosamine-1-phosphate transferase